MASVYVARTIGCIFLSTAIIISGCASVNNKFILSRPAPAYESDQLKDVTPPGNSTVTLDGRQYQQSVFQAVSDLEDLSVLSPHDGIVWPGALIVGHSNGEAGVVTPITLSLAAQTLTLNNVSKPSLSGTSIKVPNPSNTAFQDARLKLFAGATSPANFSLEVSEVYSAQDAATKIGASFGSLSGDLKTTFSEMNYEEQHVYVVRFIEKYCTVSVNPPTSGYPIGYLGWWVANFTSPSDFASVLRDSDESFLYVQSVTYGRMGIAAFASNYSKSQIQEALEASYKALASNGSFSMSHDEQSVAESIHAQLIIYGGSGGNAYEATSGDFMDGLRGWVKNGDGKLEEGLPISYTLSNLADGSPAALHTEYNYSTYKPFAQYDSFRVEIDSGSDGKDHDTYFFLDIYRPPYRDDDGWLATASQQGFVDTPYAKNSSTNLQLDTKSKLNSQDANGLKLRLKLTTNGKDHWIINNIVVTAIDRSTGDTVEWDTGGIDLDMDDWHEWDPANQVSFPLRRR
jgi:Thiol-activated cytolysin